MKLRKRIGALICALTFLMCDAGCRASNESYSEVFDGKSIVDVKITISDENLSDMREYAANEEFHTADVEIDGEKIENVGIRTKGNLTLNSVSRSDSDRYSYKIKFDKYVKKQTYLGLDELCLNNGYSDPSYMREFLHYEALSYLGVDVPETSFCRVYINGELQGLYLAVEAIDDTYLEDAFGENYKNGQLYKMEKGSSLKYEENEQYSYAELKVGTDDEKAGLKKLIKTLNSIADGDKGDIEDVLDVSSALKYIAANTVLCNYDSYNGNMQQNYFLYKNEDGKFTVIPWDFNMSFGGFDGENSEIGIDTPVSSGSVSDYPLIEKLLSVDEYKTEYYSYIEKLLEYLDGFEDRVSEIKKLIRSDVKNDPTAFYTYDEFESSTTYNSESDNRAESGNQTANDKQMESGNQTANDKQTQSDKQADKQTENDKRGDRGFGGGGKSIINCAKSRVENIKKQLSGEQSKTTENSGFGGRGNGGGPGGFRQPPQNMDGNAHDASASGGMGQPPQDMDGNAPGEMGQPQDMNGNAQGGFGQPPQNTDGNAQGGMGQPPQDMDGNAQGGFGQPPQNTDGNAQPPETGSAEQGDQPTGNRPTDNNPGNFGGMRSDKNFSAKPDKIRVNVNGNILSFENNPYIEDGRTLVPIRKILEALGLTVDWDNGKITVTDGNTTVVCSAGDNKAYVNGEEYTLDVPVKIDSDTAFVPVRFISECFGFNVSWTEKSQLIEIIKK